MPTRKLQVSVLSGAIVTVLFYVLVQVTGVLHPDPPAAVGAATVVLVSGVLQYVIPEKDQIP